jgi:16S rRNA pseudouridine516 synthase
VLSQIGIASRSELKKMAKQGRIQVNATITKDCSVHVNPLQDTIMVDHQPITYRKNVYWMLNKPQGVISATEDDRDKTVIDLLQPAEQHFAPFPVGRLDKDTEGLLLLTNDGKLAHQLLSPKKHVDKTYFAIIDGEVGEDAVRAFQDGVTLDDGYVTMPAQLQIDGQTERGFEIHVTIQEGKFHQVKRMFQAIGRKVEYLKRIRMGTLQLDPTLGLGEYRELTEQELAQLQQPQLNRAIQLVALDVDGTLLRDDHSLSQANIEAIHQCVKHGIEVVLCTGRGAPNALPVFQKIGLSGTIICHNGAATVVGDTLTILEQFDIHPTHVVALIEKLRDMALFFDVSTANQIYVERMTEDAKQMYDLFELVPSSIQSLNDIQSDIVKVTVFEKDKLKLDAILSELETVIPNEIALVRSGDSFIDFMVPNVNKGMALAKYVKAKGFTNEQVVAVGNYNNDIDMLSYAGIGIAVSNATEDVLKIADEVVPSNNEDGVAYAIQRYVLTQLNTNLNEEARHT